MGNEEVEVGDPARGMKDEGSEGYRRRRKAEIWGRLKGEDEEKAREKVSAVERQRRS